MSSENSTIHPGETIFEVTIVFIWVVFVIWHIVGLVLTSIYLKTQQPTPKQNTILIGYGFGFIGLVVVGWVVFVLAFWNAVGFDFDDDEYLIFWKLLLVVIIVTSGLASILPSIGMKIHQKHSLKVRRKWQQAAAVLYSFGIVGLLILGYKKLTNLKIFDRIKN